MTKSRVKREKIIPLIKEKKEGKRKKELKEK